MYNKKSLKNLRTRTPELENPLRKQVILESGEVARVKSLYPKLNLSQIVRLALKKL